MTAEHDRTVALSERALFGFNWALLTSGGQAMLSLGIVMVLSRLLTPEHFGQLAIAIVFLTLCDTAVRRGVGPALVQRLHLTGHHLSAGFALSFGAGILLAALLFGIAPQLASLIGQPDIAPFLRVLSLAVVATGASVASEHALRRELRFRALMVAAVTSQTLAGAISIVLALLGKGVWALVMGALVRQLVFSLIAILYAPPPRNLPVQASAAADLVRTGVGFSMIALLNVLSFSGINLAIAATLGASQLGLYTRARSLANAPTRIAPPLRDVLMPAMAQRQNKTSRLRRVHANLGEMLSLAVLPLGLFLMVAAPEIVAVILGAQWQDAVPALRVLALAGMAQTLGTVQVAAIRALGAVYRETWRRALYLGLLLGGVLFASRWGLLGAAVAVCLAQLMLFAMLAKLALSLLDASGSDLLRRQLPALWTSLVAGIALWVVSELVRGADFDAITALVAQLFVWGLAALAALYLAPAPVRPSFAGWVLGRLPPGFMGAAGRLAHALLAPLALREPGTRKDRTTPPSSVQSRLP